MMNREEKINKVISLFDAHIRGAGDYPGVVGRTDEYMKEFIESIINKNSSVLDVGCGDCYTYEYLKDKVAVWEGTNKGIDLENNKYKYPIYEMDMHFLNYEDNFFDLILAVNVLEHSYFPAMMLYELWRVTKQYVFLDFPLSMSDGGSHCHQENPDHHYLMTQFMWEKMFRIIGFSIVNKKIIGAEIKYLLQKKVPLKAC
jgi:ubiquinone/menaquinone biosynthesis C-methylase UbiE